MASDSLALPVATCEIFSNFQGKWEDLTHYKEINSILLAWREDNGLKLVTKTRLFLTVYSQNIDSQKILGDILHFSALCFFSTRW